MLMTESRTKVTWFTHTNYEMRDYERSNKGSLYGSMVNKPRRQPAQAPEAMKIPIRLLVAIP